MRPITQMLTTALLAGCFMAAPALAKVISVPAEDALATVNAPDAWDPSETDNGFEMTSEDGTIYIGIEAVKADKIEQAVADAAKLLAGQGLIIDDKSMKQQDHEANGMKLHDFNFDAKDNDGPTEFAISLLETRDPKRFVMFTFWGTAEAQAANKEIVRAMLQSVQLTK